MSSFVEQDEPAIGVKDAARLLGVRPRTVTSYQRWGLLPKRLTRSSVEACEPPKRGPAATVGVMTRKEAAKVLCVELFKVQNWQKSGVLPAELAPEAVYALKRRIDVSGGVPVLIERIRDSKTGDVIEHWAGMSNDEWEAKKRAFYERHLVSF